MGLDPTASSLHFPDSFLPAWTISSSTREVGRSRRGYCWEAHPLSLYTFRTNSPDRRSHVRLGSGLPCPTTGFRVLRVHPIVHLSIARQGCLFRQAGALPTELSRRNLTNQSLRRTGPSPLLAGPASTLELSHQGTSRHPTFTKYIRFNCHTTCSLPESFVQRSRVRPLTNPLETKKAGKLPLPGEPPGLCRPNKSTTQPVGPIGSKAGFVPCCIVSHPRV